MGTTEYTFLIDSVRAVRRGETQDKVETKSTPPSEAVRRAECRLAIEASTARILELALTCGDLDSDPEAS